MTITVDCHTHILPPALAKAIRKAIKSINAGVTDEDDEPGCCSTQPGKHMMYSPSPSILIEQLSKESTEKQAVWTLPYVRKPNTSSSLNKAIIQLAKENSTESFVIIPGCTAHALDGLDAKHPTPDKVLAEAAALGAKVIKLHVSVGGQKITHSNFQRFFELAEALRMPVLVHPGAAESGCTEKHELDDFGTICKRYPYLPVILGHSALPNVGGAVQLAKIHKNLYLDTTPVIGQYPDLFIKEEAAHVLHLAHSGRILFGSDAPTTASSRGDSASAVKHWLRQCVVATMGSSNIEDVHTEMERILEESERLIFGQASARLLEGVQTLADATGRLQTHRL